MHEYYFRSIFQELVKRINENVRLVARF